MKSLNKVLALMLCLVLLVDLIPAVHSSPASAPTAYTVPVISEEYKSNYVTLYEHVGKFYMTLGDIAEFTRCTLTEDSEKLTLTQGVREVVITKATAEMVDSTVAEQGKIPLLEHNGEYLCEAIPMLTYLGATCSIREGNTLEVLMPLYTIWEAIMPDYMDYCFDINKLYGGEDHVKISLICDILSDVMDSLNGHGLKGNYDLYMEDALYEVLNLDMMKYSSVKQSITEDNQKINDFLSSEAFGTIVDTGSKAYDTAYELLDYYCGFYAAGKHDALADAIIKTDDLEEASKLAAQLQKKVYDQAAAKENLSTAKNAKNLISAGMLAFDTAITSYRLMQYDDDTRYLFSRTINDEIFARSNYYGVNWKKAADKISTTLESNASIITHTAADKIANFILDEMGKMGAEEVISFFTKKANIYVAGAQIGLHLASLINYDRHQAYSADMNAILLNTAHNDVVRILTLLMKHEAQKFHLSNTDNLVRIKDMLTLYYRLVIAFSENLAVSLERNGGKDRQKWIEWFSSTEEGSAANYAAGYLYRVTNCTIVPIVSYSGLTDTVLTSDSYRDILEQYQSISGYQKQLTRIDKYDEFGALINYSSYSYQDSGFLRSAVSRDIDQGQCVFELQTTYTFDDSNRFLSKVTENPEYPGESSGVEYTYDSQGHMIRSISWEGGGAEMTYEYDARDRVIRTTELFESGYSVTEHTYDDSGRLVKDVTTTHEDESGDIWTDTTVYTYDAEGRLSSTAMEGAYQTVTEVYDYACLPFVIVDHCYNGGSHSFYAMLPDGSPEMLTVVSFDDPEFYTDEDGYLAKVIDHTDYWGTCVYEFYYQDEIAKPVNGPFRTGSGEVPQAHTSDEAEALLYEYLVQIYGSEGLSVSQVNSTTDKETRLQMTISDEDGGPIYVIEWYRVDLETGLVKQEGISGYVCDLW